MVIQSGAPAPWARPAGARGPAVASTKLVASAKTLPRSAAAMMPRGAPKVLAKPGGHMAARPYSPIAPNLAGVKRKILPPAGCQVGAPLEKKYKASSVMGQQSIVPKGGASSWNQKQKIVPAHAAGNRGKGNLAAQRARAKLRQKGAIVDNRAVIPAGRGANLKKSKWVKNSWGGDSSKKTERNAKLVVDSALKSGNLVSALAAVKKSVASGTGSKAGKAALPRLLELAARKGSAVQYADALAVAAQNHVEFDVVGFTRLCVILTSRVPIQPAMVRLTLNLAIPQGGQVDFMCWTVV